MEVGNEICMQTKLDCQSNILHAAVRTVGIIMCNCLNRNGLFIAFNYIFMNKGLSENSRQKHSLFRKFYPSEIIRYASSVCK